jgi:hypothetical protein
MSFHLLTKIVENSVFWDITSCSLPKVNWRFGGICRLHLQGPRISRARKHVESSACFLLGFDTECGGDMFLRNISWLSSDYTALYTRR